MPKRTRKHEDSLSERLRDPEYALAYLQAAIEDDDDGHSDAVFLLALRAVAQANRMTHVADAAGLSRESLYRALSPAGNPSLSSLRAVLRACGFDLSIKGAGPKAPASDTTAQEVGANSQAD
jgi:probable addiction module antidote protein